jgi:hypothetical protein
LLGVPPRPYSGKISVMRFSAAGRIALVTGLLAAALTSSCGRSASMTSPTNTSKTASTTLPAATAARPVTAKPVPPDRRVGAVFVGSASLHTCTGAVLDSAGGDLILTAAHCLSQGSDATFVAGFNDDAAPEDVWHIDAVYLDPRWVQNQDPLADFAIARVSRDSGGTLEAQAGSALTLAPAPKPGTTVTVTGYASGVGGGPIGCRTATAAVTNGFPSLPCAELVDGLSGAPWVTGSDVTGLIGGLDGGGCDNDSLSYSPPFDDAITGLYARAQAGGPADDAPTGFADDCY